MIPLSRSVTFITILSLAAILTNLYQGGGFLELMKLWGLWLVILMSAYHLSLDPSKYLVYRGKYSG